MVQRLLYYALTGSIWQRGIGLMVRRCIVLSSDHKTVNDLIQEDINKIDQIDCKTVILDRYKYHTYGYYDYIPESNVKLSDYHGINIRYTIYDGTDETSIVTCKNVDLTKATLTVCQKFDKFDKNYVPSIFEENKEKTVHYLILYEFYNNDSYPEFVSGKIKVTSYGEFDTFMKEQMKKLESKIDMRWDGVPAAMAHYFIEGQTQWERWL